MVYSVKYGLYNINSGGRTFINAPNIERARSRAIRLAHNLFLRKVNDNCIRFPSQKKLYEKVVNDLHLPNTWDKCDVTWEYVSILYWSMVDDYIWYKVEEAPDVSPRVVYEEWEEF